MSQIKNFTPREIVSELDRYVIGQNAAKKAVAIAMRNRWRRQQLSDDLKDEVAPKNIIMIGPTGVGKTEIARRLAKLAGAPFVKVEASKFTEVGYVGKDVESMIRELADIAVNMVREDEEELVQVKAEEQAEERLLDLLLPAKPKSRSKPKADFDQDIFTSSITENEAIELPPEAELDEAEGMGASETREKMRQMLRAGKLDKRSVELDDAPIRPMGGLPPMVEIVSTTGNFEDIGKSLKDMFSQMMPKGNGKKKKVKVPDALQILKQEEAQKLIEMDDVAKKAVQLVEQMGIVFIDEIDKIASRDKSGQGPDVSREGVQRDILPIVEGSRVNTKYGIIRTDHILFIAAGAFHMTKPSDLIPELQGRFPIRVELASLTQNDFFRILTEPKASLSRQYISLIKTEGVTLQLSDDSLREIARFATVLNEELENIGARRLHTILEKVLDEVSFNASEMKGQTVSVDASYVIKALEGVVANQDLSRYIL